MKYTFLLVVLCSALISQKARAVDRKVTIISTRTESVMVHIVPGSIVKKDEDICGLELEVENLSKYTSLTASARDPRVRLVIGHGYCAVQPGSPLFHFNELVDQFKNGTLAIPLEIKILEVRDMDSQCHHSLIETMQLMVPLKGTIVTNSIFVGGSDLSLDQEACH